MLRKTLLNTESPKILKHAQSHLNTNAQHLLSHLEKQLPS